MGEPVAQTLVAQAGQGVARHGRNSKLKFITFAGVEGSKYAWTGIKFLGSKAPGVLKWFGNGLVRTADNNFVKVATGVTAGGVVVTEIAARKLNTSVIERPLIKTGEETGKATAKGVFAFGTGFVQGVQAMVPEIPGYGSKIGQSFTKKEGAKDPLWEAITGFAGKKAQHSQFPQLTNGEEIIEPSSFEISPKLIATNIVLGQVALGALLHYRNKGVKTTKDKVVAATGMASGAAAITGIFSPKALSHMMDLTWDGIRRTAIPISLGAMATKCFMSSHQEGLNSNKGKTQAAYGITALAGSVMSAVFLNS